MEVRRRKGRGSGRPERLVERAKMIGTKRRKETGGEEEEEERVKAYIGGDRPSRISKQCDERARRASGPTALRGGLVEDRDIEATGARGRNAKCEQKEVDFSEMKKILKQEIPTPHLDSGCTEENVRLGDPVEKWQTDISVSD